MTPPPPSLRLGDDDPGGGARRRLRGVEILDDGCLVLRVLYVLIHPGNLSDRSAHARARLAAFARIRSAPAGDELHDLTAAAHAWLALAQMHLEAVLERALHPVGVAEVVDRRAPGVDPGGQHELHRVGELLVLRALQRA